MTMHLKTGLPPRLKGKSGSVSVPCPHCGESFSSVLDTRLKGPLVRRIRCCRSCSKRFNTHETAA